MSLPGLRAEGEGDATVTAASLAALAASGRQHIRSEDLGTTVSDYAMPQCQAVKSPAQTMLQCCLRKRGGEGFRRGDRGPRSLGRDMTRPVRLRRARAPRAAPNRKRRAGAPEGPPRRPRSKLPKPRLRACRSTVSWSVGFASVPWTVCRTGPVDFRTARIPSFLLARAAGAG